MSTMLEETSIARMEDDESWLDYLDFALTQFSKGTANVTPADRHKLLPLLRYYAKKPHPFTACVRDNRKRFGPRAEAICAVVKDLIVGNTHWRGKGKVYRPRAVLASEDNSEFQIEVPESFLVWLSEVTPEQIDNIIEELELQDPSTTGDNADANLVHVDGGIDLPPTDANYRQADNPQQSCATCTFFQRHPVGDDGFCSKYNSSSDAAWVSDGWEAAGGTAPGATPTATHAAEFADPNTFHELFMADQPVGDDGWTVLVREGHWAMSPEQGTQKPVARPIVMKPDGETVITKERIEVSMSDLMEAWKDGAIEHVTIPTSHADGVLENTGFIRDMRMGQDEEGKAILEVLPDFRDPEVKEKARLGTIANKSAGILFDYVRKVDGKKFRAAIGHMALTNKPWLNGLKPFGVNAGENIAVMSFSEATHLAAPGNHMLPKGVTPCTEGNSNGFTGDGKKCHTHDGSSAGVQAALKAAASDAGVMMSEEELSDYARHHTGGGDTMSELLDELKMSEDELRAAVAERETLLAEKAAYEQERRTAHIEELCTKWENEDHKAPAVITKARELLMADVQGDKLLLSENGRTKELSFSDAIEQLVDSMPELTLSTDDKSGGEEEASKGKEPPADAETENEFANLSQDVKARASELWLAGNISQEDAIKKAKDELEKNDE